jgi:hypothetical protein
MREKRIERFPRPSHPSVLRIAATFSVNDPISRIDDPCTSLFDCVLTNSEIMTSDSLSRAASRAILTTNKNNNKALRLVSRRITSVLHQGKVVANRLIGKKKKKKNQFAFCGKIDWLWVSSVGMLCTFRNI